MIRPRTALTTLLACSILQLGAGSASASPKVPPVPNFRAALGYQVGYTAHVVTADFNHDGIPDLAFPDNYADVAVALGNGDGTLGAVIHSASGFDPDGIVTADFNGDGTPDVAVTHMFSNVLSVLIGNGDGSFMAPADYPVADALFSIATGDVNGDGWPDLLVGNELCCERSPRDVHEALIVLLNNGDGTFGAYSQYPLPSQPFPIAVADFNKDGFGDVVVGLGFDVNSIAVFVSDSVGDLHGPKIYPLSSYPIALATGFLNHDGLPDIVTVNGDGNVNVLLNQGPSGFAPEVSYASGNEFPESVVIGDVVEGDGPDLVTGGVGGGLAVLSNLGDGTFGAGTPLGEGAAATSLITVDLNLDGHLDVVCAAGQAGLTVVLGNGHGKFYVAPVAAVSSEPIGVRVGDLNGDGEPDLAVLNNADPNFNGDVSILLWTAPDTFALAGDLPAGRDPQDIALADFNGDGAQDLVIADGQNDSQNLTLILGNGDGTFRQPNSTGLVNFPTNVATADFNGDGNADIAVAIANTGTQTAALNVLLGNGDGTFQTPVTYAGPHGFPTGMVVTDVDRDGRKDAVVLSQDDSLLEGGGLALFLGKGDGSFQTAHSLRLGFSTGGLALADFNGDQVLDLVMVDLTNKIAVALGLGNGTFGPLTEYDTGADPSSVAVGDLNGDGVPDIAVGHMEGTVGIFAGVGDGSFDAPVYFANGDAMSGLFGPMVALGHFHGGHVLDLAVAEHGESDVAVLQQLPPLGS